MAFLALTHAHIFFFFSLPSLSSTLLRNMLNISQFHLLLLFLLIRIVTLKEGWSFAESFHAPHVILYSAPATLENRLQEKLPYLYKCLVEAPSGVKNWNMADHDNDRFPELSSMYRRGSASKFNQLSRKVANIKLSSEQTGDSGGSSSRQHGSGRRRRNFRTTGLNAWRQPNSAHNLATMGNDESGQANSNKINDEVADKEYNVIFDSDEDLSLDDFDSDIGEKNHEELKKSKGFKVFFDDLSRMSKEEIASSRRRLHCPACKGGPGAIDWYHGVQPLLNHSRTIKSRRVKLHRQFADTLEEECHRRQAPLTTPNEVYGMWEGLDYKVKDHDIIWPPMVMIMNTAHQRDLNNKWNGVGNQELLDIFHDYAAVKAQQAYGPQGHRGMSVLIFETSAAGYLKALHLHNDFKEQGKDREAWNKCTKPFVQGGKRQLYGFLASKADLDFFNCHSGGRLKLKFAMRPYKDMVHSKIKYIKEDSQVQLASELVQPESCQKK